MNKFLSSIERDRLVVDVLLKDVYFFLDRGISSEEDHELIKSYIKIIEYYMPLNSDSSKQISELYLRMMAAHNQYLG